MAVTKYRTRIAMPEEMRSMIQEIQAVGAVVDMNETSIVVEFDVGDDGDFTLYELGHTVRDLEGSLDAYYNGESSSIPKPEVFSDA